MLTNQILTLTSDELYSGPEESFCNEDVASLTVKGDNTTGSLYLCCLLYVLGVVMICDYI